MKIQGSYVVLEALVGFLEWGKSSSSGRSCQQQGVLGLGWQMKGMGKGKARCCLQLCCRLPPNESQNHRISISSLTCEGTINTTRVWGALHVSDSFAKGCWKHSHEVPSIHPCAPWPRAGSGGAPSAAMRGLGPSSPSRPACAWRLSQPSLCCGKGALEARKLLIAGTS